MPGIDPHLLSLASLRAALAERDITKAYKILTREGIPQRRIAELTGQCQSEVSEIIKGRRVQAYDVLVRICDGLGIPREAMGLSFGAYAVDSSVFEPGGEDPEDVLRRQFQHLLALAGVAAFGSVIPGGGQLGAPPAPGQLADVPLRVGRPDVEAIRDLTAAVADAARGVDSASARSALARARDGWSPPSLHSRADFDLTAAMVQLNLGGLDAAEVMAATAVKIFSAGSDRREGTLADIYLARLHVIAGEPDAARLAAQAVEGVIPTRSAVARAALQPLAGELERRPRSDFVELAHRAGQVATARV